MPDKNTKTDGKSKSKTASRGTKSKGSKSKLDDPEAAARKARASKRRTQNAAKQQAVEQMSCVNADARRTRTRTVGQPQQADQADQTQAGGDPGGDDKHALANHLRSIAPFNKRWKVTQTINEGTYGVVFAVQDVETGVNGVIKVAKSVGNDAGNQTAEWEGFILEKMYRQVSFLPLVRLQNMFFRIKKVVLSDFWIKAC